MIIFLFQSPNAASDSEGEDFQGSESDWNPNTSDCGSDEGVINLFNYKPTK